MQRIKELIENLNRILPEDSDTLKQLSAQYPYASVIQLLYTYILNKQENYNFNAQLKIAASTINSRTKLFGIIHGNHNIQVNKYHNEPVYVQTSDKIDDLPSSSENFNSRLIELPSLEIKRENEGNKIDELEQKSAEQNFVFTDTNSLTQTENRSLTVDLNSDNLVSEEGNKINEEPILQADNFSQIDSSPTVQHTQEALQNSEQTTERNIEEQTDSNAIKNSPYLDTIRLKIKEKFGEISDPTYSSIKNPEPSPTSQDNPTLKSNEFDQTISSSNDDSPREEINKSEEKPDKIIPLSTISETTSKERNEQLDHVLQRASKILENLNALKKKYGSLSHSENNIIVDNNSEQLSDFQSAPKQSIHTNEISITSEEPISLSNTAHIEDSSDNSPKDNVENTIDPKDEEAKIEFDLTKNDSIADAEISLEESSYILADDFSKETNTKPENNTEWILEEPVHSEYSKDEIIEKTSVDNSDSTALHTSEDSEDIFVKWMSKLSPSIEKTSESNEVQSDYAKTLTTISQVGNPFKKTEKLKIIDNFLSGNIQIKPKSNINSPKEVQDLSKKFTETSPDLMTETLAELYLSQGHIDKAIQAFEILKLKNPEKSTFFVRKIQELKKKK